MGGLAQLCCENGWNVSGSDERFYPPMSDQLRHAGIVLHHGFDARVLTDDLDIVVIGNSLSRGNPVVEEILNHRIKFISGPELLRRLIESMTVLAIAGTHGKTTTSSLLAHLLECAGLKPGFLIGGVPENFGVSARLGKGDYFVVEADEYDTAFFDKRSKFLHYYPDIFGINNLEFDHADIFDSLSSIEKQFHHAIRCISPKGTVVARSKIDSIDRVLKQGIWSNLVMVGQDSEFCFSHNGRYLESATHYLSSEWIMRGTHNARNAELAIAMASTVGVGLSEAFGAISSFQGVTGRLNKLFENNELVIWDDFAHHPTAIAYTIETLKAEAPTDELHAVIELKSNTMRAGVHRQALFDAIQGADSVTWVVTKDIDWDTNRLGASPIPATVVIDVLSEIPNLVCLKGQIVFMSNGDFSGIQKALIKQLTNN